MRPVRRRRPAQQDESDVILLRLSAGELSGLSNERLEQLRHGVLSRSRRVGRPDGVRPRNIISRIVAADDKQSHHGNRDRGSGRAGEGEGTGR